VVVGTLKVECFLGLRPGPFLERVLFAHWAGVYLTENVFKGHAARLFLPSGQGFRLSASHFFFARAKKK